MRRSGRIGDGWRGDVGGKVCVCVLGVGEWGEWVGRRPLEGGQCGCRGSVGRGW